jgi:hypothetical protein
MVPAGGGCGSGAAMHPTKALRSFDQFPGNTEMPET